MLRYVPAASLDLVSEISSNGGQYSKTSWSPIRPPKNIQVRLVYLDAIELFIRIHVISMAKRITSHKQTRHTLIDLDHHIPSSVKNGITSLLPRKICNLDNQWVLVWPKLNLRATLTDPVHHWCRRQSSFT